MVIYILLEYPLNGNENNDSAIPVEPVFTFFHDEQIREMVIHEHK